MLTEEISVCVIKRCCLANIQGNTEIEKGKMAFGTALSQGMVEDLEEIAMSQSSISDLCIGKETSGRNIYWAQSYSGESRRSTRKATVLALE